MYQQATYHDVVDEVRDELGASVAFAVRAGLPAEAVLVDPGLGFAKTATQSFEVLARCAEFAELGRPIVIGPSRKSFLVRDSQRTIDGRHRGATRVAGPQRSWLERYRPRDAVPRDGAGARGADEIRRSSRPRYSGCSPRFSARRSMV